MQKPDIKYAVVERECVKNRNVSVYLESIKILIEKPLKLS